MRAQLHIVVVGLVGTLGACGKKSGSPDDAGSGGGGGSVGVTGNAGESGDAAAGGDGGTGGASAGGAGGGPTIRTVDAGTATTLATGKPADIAVDSTFVYWTDTQAKALMKVPKAGGAPITLASSQDFGAGLAVDDARVYWTTTQGAVMEAGLDGSAPGAIASQQRSPNSLVLGFGYLCWANAGANFVGTGSVMRASLATGEVVTLAANRDGVGSLVVEPLSATLYWIENGEGPGSIERLPLAGGTVESAGIAVQGSWPVLEGLAVASGSIYWSVFIQPNGGHRVVERAIAGGTETTLLSASHGFSPLVAEGLVLYTPEGHTILRIGDGGQVSAIPTDGTPTRLALFINDAHIYFTTAEGAVMRIGKP